MCFMGYLLLHGQHPNLTMFDISLSDHHQSQYEEYIKYLQDVRKLAKGETTMSVLNVYHSKTYSSFAFTLCDI